MSDRIIASGFIPCVFDIKVTVRDMAGLKPALIQLAALVRAARVAASHRAFVSALISGRSPNRGP
jgi:hypothetical protein